jgi:hypothetical protein
VKYEHPPCRAIARKRFSGIGGEAFTREMLLAMVLIVISVCLVLFRKSATVKDAVEEAIVEGAAAEP